MYPVSKLAKLIIKDTKTYGKVKPDESGPFKINQIFCKGIKETVNKSIK